MEKKKQQFCYTFLLGLFLVFCVNTIHAQIIKGKITRDGEAVSMINIQTKKQQFISTSDVNGQFVIGANAGDDLVIRQGDSIWIVQAVQDIQIELNELSRNTKTKTKTKQKQEVIPVNYSNNWGDSLGTISRFSHTEFNQGNIFDPYELI